MTQRPLTDAERNQLRASIGMGPVRAPGVTQAPTEPPVVSGMFAHGYPTRKAVCECGKEYTQTQLSKAWCEMATKHDPTFPQQFPGGWTPDYCPRCSHLWNIALERSDHLRGLKRQAEANVASRKQHVIHELEKPRQELIDV